MRRRVLAGAAVAVLLALGWAGARLAHLPSDLSVPPFATVRAAHHPSDVEVLDRQGRLLHEVRVDLRARRTVWVPLAAVSPALQAAVIASEDRRFNRHGGVDALALLSAGLQRLRGGPSRGGSTISMQVAASLDRQLGRSRGRRSPGQKWRQVRLAWALEAAWSKAEILEAYVNRVTFRGELQGVGAAAGVLFGKTPHGLSETEAAVLAALIRSPNAGRAPVGRRARQLLAAQGRAASDEEVDAVVAVALERPVGLRPAVAAAPHLAQRLLARRDARAAGEPLHTTLDRGLQEFATEALRRHVLAAGDRHVRDGAVLVVENRTGEVRAYVGGTGPTSGAAHVDGVRAPRQAGSTLKPFLYALAIERRLLTAASLLADEPLDLPVARGLFRPGNYDEQFRGPVSVRSALAGSINIPAVRALDLVGVEAFAGELRALGFAGLTEAGDYYGPSLALGAADVTLWELVGAYRTLALGGERRPIRVAAADAEMFEWHRILSPEVAFIVGSILADRESRAGTFGLQNPLALPFWSAVKTGTSKDMRDNWCVGYSPRYTTGVWVGNFSGEPMRDVSGVTGAAPVWAEVMAWLHQDARVRPPEPPAGVRAAPIRFAGGVEVDRAEWFLRGTEPPTPAAFAEQPRIVAPAASSIIALDPDIPADQQRLALEARVGPRALFWVLDGADLGPAGPLQFWRPEPGRHTLALVDDARRPIDEVRFLVRGAR